MPYSAPVTYADPPAFIDQYTSNPDYSELLRLLDSGRQAAQAEVGVSEGAVTALATDGAIDVPSVVVSDALVDGAAGAGVVGGGTVVVVAASSIALAEGIRQIPGWDNFAQHIGLGILDGLFGLGSHPSLTPEVKLYVADYVQHRFINQRQREATQFNMLHGQLIKQAKSIGALSTTALRLNKATEAARQHAQANAKTYTDARVKAAIDYANARAHNVGVASEQYARDLSAGDRTYAHNIAAQAERNANAYTHHEVHSLLDQLPHLVAPAIAAAVAAHVAPITKALSQLQKQVNNLQTENDECTEPMCDVVGPKSDWGKLLKRFAPKAIFALLAVLAAEHPDEVAKAAADLGSALGPVLESAMAAALIPLADHPIGQPHEVGGALGPFPL